MNAFLYGVALQWKLDIRSKSLLVTCYLVPLVFFALMGGIFTSITPEMKATLIQTMTVMGVSMGAFTGMPPSILETYRSDIKKVYQANGVPLYLSLISMFLSTFTHLFLMCIILLLIAPLAFDAALPASLPLYFASLTIFMAVSLSVGSILGLLVKNHSKLTMISQLIFLPSIMLSGIMFPIDLLPRPLQLIGKAFPASWGYALMLDDGFQLKNIGCLLVLLLASLMLSGLLLKRIKSQ